MVVDLLEEKMNEIMSNESHIQSLVESGELVPIQEGVYYDIVNEKAKFELSPKFKDDKDTEELFKAAKEAEGFLNSNGIETKTDAEKGWNIVFKVLRAVNNVTNLGGTALNIVKLPSKVSAGTAVATAAGVSVGASYVAGVAVGVILGTIIRYLMKRLINWAYRAGQGAMAKSNARKTIAELTKLKKKCVDKQAKDRIDGYINNINDMLDKYEGK